MLSGSLNQGPSRRVLDLGCGTGEHSRFLADQGFDVVGVDLSPSMISTAGQRPLPDNLEFVEGHLAEIENLVEGDFGGAICLGNTLPHIRQADELQRMLDGLRRRLLPGAPLLIQLLNYERIFERQERYLPLNFRSDGEEEIVFLRLMELQEDGQVLFFPSTLRWRPGNDPPLEVKASKQVKLRGWRARDLEQPLVDSGFSEVRQFGDFSRGEFIPLDSRDLILLAR